MSVHANSVAAYHSEEVKLSTRAEAVYAWVEKHGPHTDREIAYGMGFGENMNAIRPRCSELIDAGRFIEVCNRKCPVTGKTVRVVDISKPRAPLHQTEMFA